MTAGTGAMRQTVTQNAIIKRVMKSNFRARMEDVLILILSAMEKTIVTIVTGMHRAQMKKIVSIIVQWVNFLATIRQCVFQ